MKIKTIEYLKKYELRFVFQNGHVRDIDFEPFLMINSEHPMINPYLNIEEFKKFRNEKYCVSCNNDIDFSANSLYENNWSEEQILKIKNSNMKFAIEKGFVKRKDKPFKKHK